MKKMKRVEFPDTPQYGNRAPQDSNFVQVPSISFLIQFSDLTSLTADTQSFKCSSIVQWRDFHLKSLLKNKEKEKRNYLDYFFTYSQVVFLYLQRTGLPMQRKSVERPLVSHFFSKHCLMALVTHQLAFSRMGVGIQKEKTLEWGGLLFEILRDLLLFKLFWISHSFWCSYFLFNVHSIKSKLFALEE